MTSEEVELDRPAPAPPSRPPPAVQAAPAAAPVAPPRRSRAKALLIEARPKQWLKNVLVFAAPGAAGVLDKGGALWRSGIAFVCFCLAAAGTYYLNDAADVEADRRHPTKRFRPIAAGEIPVRVARIVGVSSIVAAIGLAFVARWELAVVVASYVTITTAYTTWLKHVAIADIVGVAAGFVLRAVAGGAADHVRISNWFFIVTSFGSLFMVVGKRRAEASEMGSAAGSVRATLDDYSPAFLAYLQAVTSGVVLIGYCLWAFEKAALTDARVPWFQLSIVPFVMAILRYALLIDSGHGGAPEEVVLRDRPMQVMALVWGLLFALGVYFTR
ncbi:MAG: decaprenyl-phosphate phosphoribosyltransferase [Acidimicrobiales bacterium]|nr:decaprenyl-phosphate phosphoribosyltransferase [Acidimicrobiales bacterium]